MNKRKTKVIAYVLDSLEHQLIPLGDCRKPCSVSPSACPSHLSSVCSLWRLVRQLRYMMENTRMHCKGARRYKSKYDTDLK